MAGSAQSRAFVCVISPKARANLALCRKHELWGFTKQARRLAQPVQSGDLLWFYVGGQGFVSLAQAASTPEPFPPEEPPPWTDGREYVLRLHLKFLVDLAKPIKPNFPPGFGGYKFDPALGLGSNALLTGFFALKPAQHAALIERSGGQVSKRYALSAGDEPTIRGEAEPPPPLRILVESGPAETEIITPEQVSEREAESLHTKAQWQLASMGRALGLDVWIPAGDRHKSYRGQKLADLSIRQLPGLGLTTQAQTIIGNIDVLWIEAGVVMCAFEVEHTTVVYSGILRLSDLVVVQPYTSIRLFIVASIERRGKVARELSRPTFGLSRPPLVRICRFLSYERLEERLIFANQHGRYLKFDWVDDLAEPWEQEAE